MTQLARLADHVGVNERTLRRCLSDGTVRARRLSPHRLHLAPAEESYLSTHWHLISELRRLLRTEHKVRTAVIFGSQARGDDHDQSDIDLLVELEDDEDFWLWARLVQKLSHALERKVELVKLKNAQQNPELMSYILRDGRVIVNRDGTWQRLKADKRRWHQAATRHVAASSRRAWQASQYLAAKASR